MKSVGWGIVGCSDIVRRRAAAAIIEQPDSKLVAFLSRDKRRAGEFASEFAADAAYDDLERFLADERVDIVYVATEVDRHAHLAIAAAEAGKHVLVEKPMAINTSECLTMINAAQDKGVHIAVAYYARFFEKSNIMKRVIDEGLVGRIVRANVRVMGWYNPTPSPSKYWRVTARGGGNMLADIGSHRLDLLTYFFGRPVTVCGLVDRLTMAYEAADTETALVQFENGVHVTVLANANTPVTGDSTTIEIYGTEGALLTDPWSEEPVSVAGSDMEPIPAAQPANAHFPLMDDFARAIANDTAPRFSGTDGMWATAVIEGAYQSAKSGKSVLLDDLIRQH